MKPEWCPHDLWEIADDLVENYGFHDVREQTNITDVWAVEDELHRQAIARALLDAHQRGRREGMEEAAKLLDEGYSREVGHHYRKDRQPSKHGRCPHGRYTYEDCESCGAAAIRAKAREVKL